MRDHGPIVIEDFNGLWRRDPSDSCPLDHFTEANNITYIEGGFETRPGLNTFMAVSDIVRMYNYKTQEEEGLLALNSQGQIFHALTDGSNTVYGPILTINGMTDFGFQAYNGRAYITPFQTFTDLLGQEYQLGMPGEFVYVYKGDGTNARKAAGFPPTLSGIVGTDTETFKSYNSRFDGVVSKGVHLLTVIDQANNILVPVFPVLYAPGNKEIELNSIPTPTGVTSRKVLMTHAIDPKDYAPDQSLYTYYEALTIPDNTTVNARISVNDAGLTVSVALGLVPVTAALQSAADPTDGFADLGFHLFAVVYETDTGYLTALGPENFASLNVVDMRKAIKITNVPVSPDSFVVKRHIVATRAIANYNGDQRGYQFFFVPEGTIEDNVGTEITISFYDADLLEDASHLIDNFSEIPAGVKLTTFGSRMVLTTTYDDESLVRLSAPGEPEAFDQVDGNVIIPLDGKPITNAQEFRNVLYVNKLTKTYGVVDNSLEPSEWPAPQAIDRGIGASVHGVATVLDSDGVNIEFVLMMNLSGLFVFNGTFTRPELTWKVVNQWLDMPRNYFSKLQIMNDSFGQYVYISIPAENKLFVANYSRGLDAKNVRWANWIMDIVPDTIALVQTNLLVIGT